MAWSVNGAACAETASVFVAVTVTSSRTGVASSARATAVLPEAQAARAVVMIALRRICIDFPRWTEGKKYHERVREVLVCWFKERGNQSRRPDTLLLVGSRLADALGYDVRKS